MIILGTLKGLIYPRKGVQSLQPQTNAPRKYSLLHLPPGFVVRVEYSEEVRSDIVSAAEIVVMIVAGAFAQNNIFVQRAEITVVENTTKISLFDENGGLVRAYEFITHTLQEAVDRQTFLLAADGRDDLKQKALEELREAL